MIRFTCLLVAALLLPVVSFGHEVRPALLTISEVSEDQYRVQWKVPAMGEMRLAIDPIFAPQCVTEDERVDANASDAALSSWFIRCEGGLADTDINFSNLSSTMVDVMVNISFLDGRNYVGLVRPSNPVFHIPDRESEVSVFGSYFVLGVEHIIFGWDHLLFVLGMVLLVIDVRRLIWAITGFTVAHSITLALAMLDVIRVPGPPVEAVIALSIVFVAVEAIHYRQGRGETLAVRAPWLVSALIGLIHGLGFAGALSEYGLPAYAKLVSLMAFNIGVEVGQLAFVAALFVAAALVRRVDERLLSSAQVSAAWLIGVCGSFWLAQRFFDFYY
jgi:hydrogenase/urease accessory protein HupE